ncbi:MAG TPA: type II toxin-antitoxin system VapC family toxin [Candidatus Acidoferrum sp.]|nr:type II toxin-antitoxin system VapC family toxin [Candidatus Acidoferrum sp.]
MIRYLIDTNVVSEMRKKKPHGGVLAWLRSLDEEQALLSAVTFGEIQRGVELTRTQDPLKANEIEAWAAQLERAAHVLPMDSACFREYARLMRDRSEALTEDAMIAATARVHGLIVATRNENDFDLLGVPVFNPFKPTGKS